MSINPNLELSDWIPPVIAALSAGLATTLSRTRWRLFLVAATLGTFGGLMSSYMIWWPTDPIAEGFMPLSVAINTLIAFMLSLVAALTARRLSMSNVRLRRVTWVLLAILVATGPMTLALTPLLVKRRIARNDQVAAERFASLQRAVQRTAAQAIKKTDICDGSILKGNYIGPSFSPQDWQRITGNFVRQDGYFFMVYCREKDGYTIAVLPYQERGYGTKYLCTDESAISGCRVEWNRSRNRCLPCAK